MKAVMVKDFAYFVNRRVSFFYLFSEKFHFWWIFSPKKTIDSISYFPIDKFLTSLQDEEWKNARSIVMKVFTAGKIKLVCRFIKYVAFIYHSLRLKWLYLKMSKHIVEVASNLNTCFDELVEGGDGVINVKKYDISEFFLRIKCSVSQKTIFNYFVRIRYFGGYIMDVISSCFFGIETDSIKNPDNEVLQNIQAVFSSKIQNLKLVLARKSNTQNSVLFIITSNR